MATEDGPSLNNDTSNFISIGAAIQAVQAMHNIDEDLLFEAFDFLEEGKNAAIFITMNASFRSKWLRKKLLPPQPIEILVKKLDGKTFTVTACMSATIDESKLKIQAIEGYLPSKIRLIHAGKQLEDGRSIADCGLKDGSLVQLVFRLCGC